MKIVNYEITFAEIPDEINLCLNISNCPNRCNGCHSSYLRSDIGTILQLDDIDTLINNNKGITCICFMGGDAEPNYINKLGRYIKSKYKDIKVAWYSGKSKINNNIQFDNFDYIKIGPYISKLGPLNSRTTNQRLYKINHEDNNIPEDITYRFWKKDVQ